MFLNPLRCNGLGLSTKLSIDRAAFIGYNMVTIQ